MGVSVISCCGLPIVNHETKRLLSLALSLYLLHFSGHVTNIRYCSSHSIIYEEDLFLCLSVHLSKIQTWYECMILMNSHCHVSMLLNSRELNYPSHQHDMARKFVSCANIA